MDFGIFTEQLREGGSQDGWFQEIQEFAEKGEAWGLDVLWLAEMLVNPARSVLSAPLLVASSIAAKTRRLRVGTAVQLLPLNHPLRIAGEITTLDHLSHGRFDFGIGRSGSPRAYDALGVSYAESQDRFFEALEIILKAWKGERFSHEGKYYRFSNAAVSPRPYRSPHPPVRMAATTPETFPRVAKLGLPIFVKPAREGSSVGMTKVKRAGDLEEAFALAVSYDPVVIAEKFIDGPELTASILGERVLPIIRIETPREFYDYEAKYIANDTRYLIPCGLPKAKEKQIQALCLKAFQALGCRGWGRVDLMLDRRGKPYLLEINTAPGMTDHSLVPMAARAVGIGYEDLCVKILEGARVG